MLEEERNHDAILNVAIANGFWLRAVDLYLNGFMPNDCPDIVKTVRREFVEPPRRSKANGNTVNGLVWADGTKPKASTSKRRKRSRSR